MKLPNSLLKLAVTALAALGKMQETQASPFVNSGPAGTVIETSGCVEEIGPAATAVYGTCAPLSTSAVSRTTVFPSVSTPTTPFSSSFTPPTMTSFSYPTARPTGKPEPKLPPKASREQGGGIPVCVQGLLFLGAEGVITVLGKKYKESRKKDEQSQVELGETQDQRKSNYEEESLEEAIERIGVNLEPTESDPRARDQRIAEIADALKNNAHLHRTINDAKPLNDVLKNAIWYDNLRSAGKYATRALEGFLISGITQEFMPSFTASKIVVPFLAQYVSSRATIGTDRLFDLAGLGPKSTKPQGDRQISYWPLGAALIVADTIAGMADGIGLSGLKHVGFKAGAAGIGYGYTGYLLHNGEKGILTCLDGNLTGEELRKTIAEDINRIREPFHRSALQYGRNLLTACTKLPSAFITVMQDPRADARVPASLGYAATQIVQNYTAKSPPLALAGDLLQALGLGVTRDWFEAQISKGLSAVLPFAYDHKVAQKRGERASAWLYDKTLGALLRCCSGGDGQTTNNPRDLEKGEEKRGTDNHEKIDEIHRTEDTEESKEEKTPSESIVREIQEIKKISGDESNRVQVVYEAKNKTKESAEEVRKYEEPLSRQRDRKEVGAFKIKTHKQIADIGHNTLRVENKRDGKHVFVTRTKLAELLEIPKAQQSPDLFTSSRDWHGRGCPRFPHGIKVAYDENGLVMAAEREASSRSRFAQFMNRSGR